MNKLAAGWLRCGWPLVGLAMALCGPLAAQPSGQQPLPVAAYLAPPDFSMVSLSADGRFLAALSPVNGKRNLLVLDLQTMKPRAITTFANFDVVRYNWVGSEYLVFSLGTLDTPSGADMGDGGGLFAAKVDGSGFRKLQATTGEQRADRARVLRKLEFMASIPGVDNEILASGNLRTNRTDVYRVNLATGERKLLTQDKPGIVTDWFVDRDGLVRAAMVQDKEDAPEAELTHSVMIRDTADGPWRELARFEPGDKRPRWSIRAFAADNKNLIVSSAAGRETSALYLFDVEKKALGEMLVGHPRYDASEITLTRDSATRQLYGWRLAGEREESGFFDPAYAALHQALQATFPDQAVRLQRTSSGRVLVTAFSDRKPHTFHLYDEASKTLKPLLRSRRDLDDRSLVQMRPFLLKTRDGLEIPSYYFLPASYQPGQKLPTVVHIHGGPHVRSDTWGPNEGWGVKEAQIFASRGYAVVLPNFRMTPGLGRSIYQGGWGEYGRKMSDDHEDAAHWAVQQGFAQAGRICISGSSYGGSASLWATIRSAHVFSCSIAGLSVSDKRKQLNTQQTDYSSSESGVDMWKRIIGVKGEDWTRSDEVAPAQHAGRSAIPLFLWAGASDRRTPLSETERMVDALTKAGKPPEIVMIKADEGHGYGKRENQIELYETMLKFLDRHIGPGSRGASATASSPVAPQPPAQQ